MKKLWSLILAATMILGLAACGSTPSNDSSSADVPETVTVSAVDGSGAAVEVEVPYDPQRVVVVDFASLDILDNLGLGDRVVGVPSITLDYLQAYAEDESLTNVGTVKTPDLEAIMSCAPDVIFMSGRGAEYYDALCEIAPVVRLISDSTVGLVESVRNNATTIASIFGAEEKVDATMADFDARIAALSAVAQGKTALVGMCTTGSFNLLGNDGRCSIIGTEIGFDNIGVDAATTGSSHGGSDSSEGGERSGGHGGDSSNGGERSGSRGGSEASTDSSQESSDAATPTHGNEASFELLVQLNPEYIFVMDRDAAIGTNGATLAQEVMENELVMQTDAYKNGNLVILAHPGVWYTGEGGITALGIMLEDLESVLLK